VQEGGKRWEAVKDKLGRTYYFCEATGEVSWEVKGAAAEAKVDQWEALKDNKGRTYYSNKASGVVQWEPPPGFTAP
jgi:hypothetical protein